MASASEYRPTALKVSQSKGGLQQALEESLTLDGYSTGDPSSSNLKPSLLRDDGTLKSSLLVNGSLKSSLVGLNAVPVSQFLRQQIAKTQPVSANGLLVGEEPGKGTQRDMQPGRCSDFDGTDDYIDYGSIGSVQSYSLWVEPDSITSTTDYVLDLNGTDYLTIVNGTVTLNGQTGTIYVDGVAGSTIPDITDPHLISVVLDSAVTASDCDLGRVEGSGFYDGLAFDLRLYSTTLTASEVQELSSLAADALPNKATALHAKLDDIHATTSYDSSGNGRDGTKTNHTTSTFHYEGSDVPFSWQNDKGYTLDGTDLVPRDESDKTKDVFGGALQYTGKCPRNGKVIESNCAHPDGTNDYVEVADHADFDITDNLTVFCRGKNDNSDIVTETDHLIGKYDINSLREWAMGIDENEKLRILVSGDGVVGGNWVSTDAVDADADNSYGFTFDGGTVRGYVNGLEVAGTPTSIPSSIFNSTGKLTVGAVLSSDSPIQSWDGTLYDARVFSGASAPLTAADMLALHNQTSDSFSGQTNVLWLPMAEGNGNKHYDASGNGNDGDISNHAMSTYFGTKQDVFPYNYKYGYSKYTHASSGDILVPYGSDGSPLSITAPSGYTKSDDHPAGAFHNLCESKIDFKAGVDFPEKDYSIRDNICPDDEFGSGWGASGATATLNYGQGPDGKYNAVELSDFNTGAGERYTENATENGARTFTFSCYMKGEGSNIGKLSHIFINRIAGTSGVFNTAGITLTGEWQRLEVTQTMLADTVGIKFGPYANAADSTVASEVLIAMPKLEEWHEATAYTPATRPTLPRAWEPPVNKILNPSFAGAVSGTPGTVPTSWIASLQNGTATAGTGTIRFAATSARHIITQPQEMAAYSIYDFTCQVTANSGTVTVGQVALEEGFPGGGATAEYLLDGVPVSSSASITGTQTVTRRYRTYSAASSGFRVRLGMGTSSNATGDATFENPTFKRIDENPAFSRQITKNGVLHRVDRMLNYSRPLLGNNLTQVENHVATKAV